MTPNAIHVRLCEALGLDPAITDMLIIHSEPETEPKVSATFRVKEPRGLITSLKEYHLEEKGERVAR